MRRFFIGILTAFLLLQGSLPAAVAQDINPTDGGNDLYIPAIPAESYSPTFSVQARKIGHNDQDFGMEPVAVTQDGKSSYIVLMSAEPLIAYNGDIAGYSATKPQAGQRLDAASAAAQEYSQLLKQQHTATVTAASVSGGQQIELVHHYTTALNGFSAIMTAEAADEVARQEGVVSVMHDTMRYKTTNSSPGYLGLTKKGEAWESGLTGEGVIVGVIDSGIWPEHPSFADDGSYPDLGIVLDNSRPTCEFGNTAHNPDDVPFTCNDKLLGARQMLDTYRALIGADPIEYDSARDDDGHGTHTASTSAGNAEVTASMYGSDLGEVSGIAPRARVIAYKGLGSLGGFGSDLAAAIDQAVFDGVDVINYSVGGGSSVPTGPDDIAFLFAADAGVFVATSAGNSGPGADTVGSPGNAPWLTTVGANTQPRFYEGEVKTKGGPMVKGASLTPRLGRSPFVDAEDFGNPLCLPDTFTPGSLTGTVVLCQRGAIGRAAKGEAAAAAGAIGMVLFNFDDDDNLFTDTHVVPTVHINYTDGLKLKAYIDKQAAKGKAAEVEIRKTGKETKAKGAPSMAYFSSRGPNGPVPDIIKPDITAPGHQILAGDSPGVNAFGDSFMAISGTSMSSPHVAGLFALIKQAHPDWSAAMARSAIMTTADTKVANEDRSTQATPFEMGAGEINPGKVDKAGSAFNPGLVYDAGLFEYAAFTCGADLGDLHRRLLRLPRRPRHPVGRQRPQSPIDRRRRARRIADCGAHSDQCRQRNRQVQGEGECAGRLPHRRLAERVHHRPRRVGHAGDLDQQRQRTRRRVALWLDGVEGQGLQSNEPDRGKRRSVRCARRSGRHGQRR